MKSRKEKNEKERIKDICGCQTWVALNRNHFSFTLLFILYSAHPWSSVPGLVCMSPLERVKSFKTSCVYFRHQTIQLFVICSCGLLHRSSWVWLCFGGRIFCKCYTFPFLSPWPLLPLEKQCIGSKWETFFRVHLPLSLTKSAILSALGKVFCCFLHKNNNTIRSLATHTCTHHIALVMYV